MACGSYCHCRTSPPPDFVAELARWTSTGRDRRDGCRGRRQAQPAPQDQWTLRDDTAGSGAARVPGKNFEHQPMIA